MPDGRGEAHLGVPDTLHSFCHSDIVGLEFVQANTSEDGGDVEQPRGNLEGAGILALGDVVDDDGLHADMAVDE